MSTPNFGAGGPGNKATRRVALGTGTAVVALIAILASLAIVF